MVDAGVEFSAKSLVTAGIVEFGVGVVLFLLLTLVFLRRLGCWKGLDNKTSTAERIGVDAVFLSLVLYAGGGMCRMGLTLQNRVVQMRVPGCILMGVFVDHSICRPPRHGVWG